MQKQVTYCDFCQGQIAEVSPSGGVFFFAADSSWPHRVLVSVSSERTGMDICVHCAVVAVEEALEKFRSESRRLKKDTEDTNGR